MSAEKSRNFIEVIIDEDLAANRTKGRVITRFPPEPNGYLHVGHAKSILLNYGLASSNQGNFHLRFDDTNPTKNYDQFIDAIQRDMKWLGVDWKDKLFFASDYFDALYDFAKQLIRKNKAYVCSLSLEEIREYRGTVKEAGKPSPYRERSVEENLDLLERMKSGEFEDGTHVVRAKIDMANPNMQMRDPLMYRIRRIPHHRTGDTWNIYPMYDFSHCLSDAIEGITHSICTLEFENNRELYDWFLNEVDKDWEVQPRQFEFAKLLFDFTVTGKRKLIQLVEEGYVDDWDDPRLPTLAGLRRRGYTPEAIQEACERVGVAKANSTVEYSFLEFCVRNDLNPKSPRVMAVLDPLKVTITNYDDGHVEELDAPYYPKDFGRDESRKLPFSKTLYIDRSDFLEEPPKKYFRLSPGKEVRLRHAYIIRCDEVIKNDAGDIIELKCSYDLETLGKKPVGRKVKGVIHWVSAEQALPAEIRLYDRLYSVPNPTEVEGGFLEAINPDSLVRKQGFVEPSLLGAEPRKPFQFEREGYFVADDDSSNEKLIFNRTVTLRDTWEKLTSEPKTEATPPPKQEKKAKVKAKNTEKALSTEEQEVATQLMDAHQLPEKQAGILAQNSQAREFFEKTLPFSPAALPLANWMTNEYLRLCKDAEHDSLLFSPQSLGELVTLVAKGEASSNLGKKIFAEMVKTGEAPSSIMEKDGFRSLNSADALSPIVEKVFQDNPSEVERFKQGEKKLFGFFVGAVMKESKGTADPKLVQSLLREQLNS